MTTDRQAKSAKPDVTETAAVLADGDGIDSSVAVIVTNWNYGHFLAGCLDSVLAQTLPATEIIVVDDGSTDGSAAVLAAYTDRIAIIRKPNGGQASAFNAGFARSTSSVVIFLDADDLLRPEAVETIATWWHPGLSSLSFRLELIDAAGRSRGIYEETLRLDEGDKRQRLIARGVFAFAPTSGNAFSRAFLLDFLPLDETRWRISADMPLIYAAALHGPGAVLQHVLGAYRTHGSNNYYRERLPDAWRLHRGMRDVVDALGLLADRQRRQGKPPWDGALELALRFAALKMRAKLQTLEGNDGDLPRHARHHLRRLLTSAIPWSLRLIGAVPFAVIGYGGWLSSTCRRWIEDVRSHPAIVHRVLRLLRDRDPTGGFARLARLEHLRWHSMVPFGVAQSPDFNGPLASVMAEGWSGEMTDTLHWSRGPEACLEFRLDPTPYAVRLDIALVMGPPVADALVVVETMIGKRRLTVDHLKGHGTIGIDLSPDMIGDDPIRLRMVCSLVPPPSLWRSALSAGPFFAIRWWRVTPLEPFPVFPLLSPGDLSGLDRILPHDPEAAGWALDGSGIAWMTRSEATCRIAVAPCPDPLALVLVWACTEASGWLRIVCNDAPLFSGTLVSGAELQCALPPVTNADDTGLVLVFTFVATDPTDTARLGLHTLGLIALRDATRAVVSPAQPAYRHINIGERVDLDLAANRGFAVGPGWDFTGTSGLRNLELEASLAFTIPSSCHDPFVYLSLEPLLPEPTGHGHIIAVSADHDLLVSARLQGVGDLAVAVPQTALRSDGRVTLTLHSFFVPDTSGAGAPVPPMFAGVNVRAISVSARPTAVHRPPGPARPPSVGSDMTALVRRASDAISGVDPTGGAELRQIRKGLVIAICRASDRAIESHLAEPAFLDTVERLGAVVGRPSHDDAQSSLATAEAFGTGQGSRLRQVLCSILLATGRGAIDPDLKTLPTSLLWSVGAMARWLAMPPFGGKADAGIRETGVDSEPLLTRVLDVLRNEPLGSARYRLAVEVLQTLGPAQDTDRCAGSAPIHRLWARSVELHLSRTGCALAAGLQRPQKPRIRLGVLVRDTIAGPESGLLFGIGSVLDPDRFEPVLVTTLARPSGGIDPDGFFEAVTDLANGAIGLCAARIRALDLDMLLVLATLDRLDMMAAIAAHRLAPVQILLPDAAGFGPGLRSLSGTRPRGGAERSSRFETMEQSPMALPCLDVFAIAARQAGRTTADTRLRPRHSIGVMLGSAADLRASWDLCELWVRVLAEAPQSALIIDMDPTPADERREDALMRGRISLICHDLHVAADRVSFRTAATRDLVDGGTEETADLYLGVLDGGALGLLNALAMPIPFVALAERGDDPLPADAWAACLLKTGLTACSPEAYVRSAVDLVRNPALRDRRLLEIQSAMAGPAALVEAGCGDAFNRALLRMASDAGLIGDRPHDGPGAPASLRGH